MGDAQLGFIDPMTAYAAYKTGSSVLSSLSNLFGGGGAATDAKRQARAQYMGQAASEGSVLAARIILAAPSNVASHETGYWQTAAAMIPADVAARAQAQGPYWPEGQPFEMPAQVQQITRELASLGQSSPASSFTSSSTALTLPTVRTTAPYTYAGVGGLGGMSSTTMLLLAGGVAAAIVMTRGGSPRRRRRR